MKSVRHKRTRKKEKILLCGEGFSAVSGWSTMTAGLEEGAREIGLEVVLLPYYRGPAVTISKVIKKSLAKLLNVIDCIRIARYIFQHPIKKILVIQEFRIVPVSVAAALKGVEVIVYGAGTYTLSTFKATDPMTKWARRRAKWGVMSHYTMERIVPWDQFCDVKVVGAALSRSWLESSKERDLDNLEFDVISVANLKPRKGLILLLEALKQVRLNIDRKVRIVLPGDYSEEQKNYLKKRFRDLTLGFPGIVSDDDLKYLYRAAAANVLLSRDLSDHFEGFGLVHLEARACGVWSIGSTDSGNADAIEFGNGVVVAPTNTNQLVDELGKAILYPKSIRDPGINRWGSVLGSLITRDEECY